MVGLGGFGLVFFSVEAHGLIWEIWVGWFGLGGWVRFGLGFLSWVGWLCSIVFDLLTVQFIPMYSVCVK